MTTYKQDLEDLNISAEEFDNIISNIYGKTENEMLVLAKAIKGDITHVLPTVKRAFERVLEIRKAERLKVRNFYYSDLNTMCYDCKKCGKDCKGTTCKTWTGCVMKKL